MKRHITKEDLATLNESQRMSLNDLWLPEKYDLAVAYICKNAETEEYDEIEFVVGNILLYHNYITLVDIRRPKNKSDEEESEDVDETSDDSLLAENNQTDDSIEEDDEEYNDDDDYDNEDYDEEALEDGDFEFSYEQPTTFSKEDCLPLLSIAQMIEILDKRNFKDCNFYLLASNYENGCEIGNNSAPLSDYGNDNEPAELCDVLWESIKSFL